MEKSIHPNFKKSSNLIFVSAALGMIDMLYSYKTFNDHTAFTFATFSILFLWGLGLLIRRGTDWARYLILILLIFGIIAIIFNIPNIISAPINGLMLITQSAIQTWAVMLLFKFKINE